MNLKNYKIKTVEELKKEFSLLGDKPDMWRVRVPSHFVKEMDEMAGLTLGSLQIIDTYLQTTIEKTPNENVIFRVFFQNYDFNISKAMIRKIDLDKKIQKILNL